MKNMPVKLVITSKNNLQFKYGKKFNAVHQLLQKLVKADAKKNLDTKIVFIDDAASARKAGIRVAKEWTTKECKRAVDDLFRKLGPAYIALLGAQDVFPFQEITNPAADNDDVVPTDLPYACDAPFSTDIADFVGPSRVLGRIPDVPGKGDFAYLQTVLENSIQQMPVEPQTYLKYFSISAWVWRKSTEKSLHNMFSHYGDLQLSPPIQSTFTKTQLKPMIHFFNCHGAPHDPGYYGQKGKSYPEAIRAATLDQKITRGTIAAAECCYGAELFDPALFGSEELSIANTYFANKALAFLGSSTIAYGPADGQGLADLITQYFIKEVLCGASLGRALLEARQLFLTNSGPQLDPYELKTLAQFYLLGDPSVQPVISESDSVGETMAKSSIENNRMRLFSKGMGLQQTIAPAKEMTRSIKTSDAKQLQQILKEMNFTDADEEYVYEVKPKTSVMRGMEKKMMGEDARYRTFIKTGATNTKVCDVRVLVVKENKEKLLGWRLYVSK